MAAPTIKVRAVVGIGLVRSGPVCKKRRTRSGGSLGRRLEFRSERPIAWAETRCRIQRQGQGRCVGGRNTVLVEIEGKGLYLLKQKIV